MISINRFEHLPQTTLPQADQVTGANRQAERRQQSPMDADQVTISAEGDKLAGAIANDHSRMERISWLRDAIESGEYDVESKLEFVVDRILDEIR